MSVPAVRAAENGFTRLHFHEPFVAHGRKCKLRTGQIVRDLRCRQETTSGWSCVRVECSASVSQTAESDSQPQLDTSQGLSTAKQWFYAFFKFTRPHTMLGTVVSIVSVSLLALVSPQIYCCLPPAVQLTTKNGTDNVQSPGRIYQPFTHVNQDTLDRNLPRPISSLDSFTFTALQCTALLRYWRYMGNSWSLLSCV